MVATAYHLLLSHGWAAVAFRAARRAPRSGWRTTSPTRIPFADCPRTTPPPARPRSPGTVSSSGRSSAGLPRRLARPERVVAPVVLHGDMEGIARRPTPRPQHLLPLRRDRPDGGPRSSHPPGSPAATCAGSPRTGCGACWGASRRRVRAAGDLDHRERRRIRRRRVHDGGVLDPDRTCYLRTIDALARAVAAGCRSGATSSGACSTTSSGRGLLEALRNRLRRLCDARARAQGQLLLVPRLHREHARRAAAFPDRGALT